MIQDISSIDNTSSAESVLVDTANSSNNHTVPANTTDPVTPFAVPEATSAAEFPNNHIKVSVDGVTDDFYFWQNDGTLYYSLDGTWNDKKLMTNDGGSGALRISVVEEKPWVVGELDVDEQ